MRKAARLVINNLVWIPVIILSAWALTPLIWALSASFKTRIEIYQARTFLPANPSLRAYGEVLSSDGFWNFTYNSTFVSIVSTFLATAIGILAAYAFARYAFRWRHILLILILVPRIIPRVSLVVPLYHMIVSFGLLDTRLALVITYTATAVPFVTWILASFFATVPKSLEDAATIDGASLWQTLFYVMIPVAWPGIAAVLIYCIREAWNEFPFVMAFTTSAESRTLPYQLFLLRETMGIQDWSVVNAFTIITIIPMVIAFLTMQRYVVKGIVSGAIK